MRSHSKLSCLVICLPAHISRDNSTSHVLFPFDLPHIMKGMYATRLTIMVLRRRHRLSQILCWRGSCTRRPRVIRRAKCLWISCTSWNRKVGVQIECTCRTWRISSSVVWRMHSCLSRESNREWHWYSRQRCHQRCCIRSSHIIYFVMMLIILGFQLSSWVQLQRQLQSSFESPLSLRQLRRSLGRRVSHSWRF